ncbi:MAG: AAA-associated domain-containing protein [Thermoplasmata archaeon]|nr:AAA-associated domain-containing protein [Thermoplasmata archaeon]
MATSYPKCSPTEMMGLIVLLNSHAGSEDVARLADDLDLEIDEILPSVDYAAVLQMVKVSDGRATLTELGKNFLASTIRDRKAVLREQLSRTTLFRTLLRALDKSPDRQLTDEELGSIVSLAQAPLEDAVQNIVNWGRYAELFRYDSEEHLLTAIRHPPAKTGGGTRPPPPTSPSEPKARSVPQRSGRSAAESETRTVPLASLAA